MAPAKKPARKAAAKKPAKKTAAKKSAPLKKATAARKTAAAKKPASTTLTMRQLGALLAENHEMPKKQANEILDDMVDILTKQLKKGTRIRLAGLGTLVVRKRAARWGRNPATGEKIRIKASKKVAFRAAKELKEAV